jgi:hypothetical protein
MQQILNNQERTQAFLKFLLFFLLTIVLVVMAVFFNYRLPSKENKLLSDEVDIQRQQETNQQKFITKMDEINLLMDSLEKHPNGFDQLSILIDSKIVELQVLGQNDNTAYGKMNKAIDNNLSKLLTDRKNLYPLLHDHDNITAVQEELKQCKTELATANASLDRFRSPK